MPAKFAARKVLPMTKIAIESASIAIGVWQGAFLWRNQNVVTECVSDAEQANIPVYYF